MSYCSAQDPRIFFGLGTHARVDALEIWWPSGLKETVTNLPADVFVRIEEGAGSAKAIRYPAVKRLPSSTGTPVHAEARRACPTAQRDGVSNRHKGSQIDQDLASQFRNQ